MLKIHIEISKHIHSSQGNDPPFHLGRTPDVNYEKYYYIKLQGVDWVCMKAFQQFVL